MTSAPGHGQSDERTRHIVETELGKSLYVEAGAGSGKTRALVSRLTSLLADGGVEPGQVAAITFTRAAAFEMRSRVRARLEELADEAEDPERSARLAAAIESLDSAAVQTIHSFAFSMLKERPLAAGLPPVVTPLDDIQSGIEFDERWTAWLGDRLESDHDLVAALGLAQRIGLNRPLESLRELAEQLAERYHLLTPGMFRARVVRTDGIPRRRIAAAMFEVGRRLADAPVANDKLFVFANETVLPALGALTDAVPKDGAVADEELVELPRIATNRSNGGNKANWSKTPGGVEMRDQIVAELAALQEEIDAALVPLRSHVLATLASAAADFTLEHAAGRRSSGSLNFHDQLVLARNLLRDDRESCDHFRRRYRVILVDEFQDTDPLQVEILRLLSGIDEAASRPGGLFLVGDPKQSIYRFRGADPSAARAFTGQVSAVGETHSLRENHRSQRPIIRWVNHVFFRWMADHETTGQARYEDLAWPEDIEAQNESGDAGSVWWFGGEHEGSSAANRSREFTEISWIAQAAGRGALQVRGSDGGVRESQFGDVAVLVKSRTGLEELEDALTNAGAPYVYEGQSPLFTSQDVRDLRSCLTVIDDPADQVATLAALRTPAFSCSDPDLLRWKRAGGSFNYLDPLPTGATGPVAAAYAALAEYHRLSREIPVVRLVEQLIRERRLREKAALSRTGPERMRRLNMVVELAVSVSGDRPVTLREFTSWMERQSAENARVPETVSGDADLNAVRIMTMHASKGLEFPIVILASARSRGASSDPAQVQVWGDATGAERLDIQLGAQALGLRTDGFEDGKTQDKAQSDLEDVRLLYVAATRARDHLVVSRHRGNKERNALVTEIDDFMQDDADLWRQWEAPPGRRVASRPEPGRLDTAADRDAWISDRRSLIASSSRPGYVTPTGLKAPGAKREPLPKEESESFDGEPGRFGRGAAERGRAVHGVLQHIPLTGWTSADLERLATRMADDHGILAQAAEVARFAQGVLDTSTLKAASIAAARGRAWREVSVAASVDGDAGALEGQIDLLFEDDDGGLVIVDYKTDRVPGGDMAEAASPYLSQMGAYAWAVEKVTGRPVKRATLIFARLAATDATGEYTVPDLDLRKTEAARQALELLSGVTPGG
jgi:ATP-dependent exoDNAse (exonuclease V) beta subunit